MPYIDYQFYANVFKGVSLDETKFNTLVDRANDFIDMETKNRILSIGFENLHPNVQLRIQKAVAAQIEYMYVNGGIASLHSDGVSSASIGSFSYSSSDSNNRINKTICDMSKRYLQSTGLLYSGVITFG